jgi:hypothetical protein
MKLFPPIYIMGIRIVTTLIVKGLQIGGRKRKSVTAYSQPRYASGGFGVIKTFRQIRIGGHGWFEAILPASYLNYYAL